MVHLIAQNCTNCKGSFKGVQMPLMLCSTSPFSETSALQLLPSACLLGHLHTLTMHSCI